MYQLLTRDEALFTNTFLEDTQLGLLWPRRARHTDIIQSNASIYSTLRTFGPLLLATFFFLLPLSKDAADA
jgi:hypothetical protein